MATSGPSVDSGRTASDVMVMSSNRAMRYVFTRTLPLKSQPEFIGESSVTDAVAEIESGVERLVEKHICRVVDDRAAVHLHMAALAVASHRTLFARIRDESRVMDMLRRGFGASADAGVDAKLPGHWIGKAALMFSPNRMAAIRKMTRNTESDFGAAFDVVRSDVGTGGDMKEGIESAREGSHHMTVHRCFYDEFCRAEGLPQVTRIFCALDRALFSHISPRFHGIEFHMSSSTLADSVDSPCTFDFQKVAS
jgi:L-2-amino-thiazoline-4-carboxylic acid hydrolase